MKMKLPRKVLGYRVSKGVRALVSGKSAKHARRALGFIAAPVALGVGGLAIAHSLARTAEPKLD